ncbi:MAG TPA: hypothetical protein VHG89_01995 [Verrucomicrobiae bacterium]|nr:hypothetical protein [Verrucomicrobiae bacterium]
MKKLFQISLLFLFVSSALAQESSAPKEKVLRVYDWKDLAGQIPNSQIISMDGIFVLKIENTNDTPLEVFVLTNSSLLKKANRIEWEMKYENVGYITNRNGIMGSSRELIEKFPPQAIGGDSLTNYNRLHFVGTENWANHYFLIGRAPYDNQTRPDELKLKFSFTSGTIYLRPIKLLGTTESFNWWAPEQSGLIGGIGGAIIGCFGGLLGWLVSKGKARNFVLITTKIFILLGILLTIGGLIAAILKQPYSVWYALLLPGVILVLVFSLNLHSIQRRYDELEIRRMTSIDTMRS